MDFSIPFKNDYPIDDGNDNEDGILVHFNGGDIARVKWTLPIKEKQKIYDDDDDEITIYGIENGFLYDLEIRQFYNSLPRTNAKIQYSFYEQLMGLDYRILNCDNFLFIIVIEMICNIFKKYNNNEKIRYWLAKNYQIILNDNIMDDIT